MASISHPLLRPGAVESRMYQEAIIAGTSKKNTIVVLPTGIGKTVIAIGVAAHRLQQLPGSRILVMAPTKPLVEQHAKSFEQMLASEKLGGLVVLTGHVAPAKRQALYKEQLVFATPQVIQNDVATGRVNLADFSLLVVDECHRSTGDYAYTFIARKYMEQSHNPLILGLTASPGGTREKIGVICANLFIDKVEIRSDEDWDVREHVKGIEVGWEKVELPEGMKKAKAELEEARNRRIKFLLKYRLVPGLRPGKKALLDSQRAVWARLAKDRDPVLFQAASHTAACIKLNHALELLQSQGVGQALDYLKKLEGKRTTKAVRGLLSDRNVKNAVIYMRSLKEEGVEHPKLERVVEIIQREVHGEKKAMVFAQYVKTVDNICSELENVKGLKPVKFIGQRKGMTQKKQKEILEKFRDGEFNTIVATSIGEEGLDIPRVDFVLFYEPVPSEIRSIQRRGRTGRRSVGKVVVLMAKNTIDEAYYWTARHKERRMRSVLGGMKGMNNEGVEVRGRPKAQQSLDAYKAGEDEKAVVYVDHREVRLVKELSELDLEVRTAQLETGDALVSDRAGVERKTTEDFVTSLIDGRLFQQVDELSKTFLRPVLIIEGSSLYGARNVHPNAVRGALSAIAVDYKLPVLWTRDAKETAGLIAVMAKREQLDKRRGVQIRGGKAGRTTAQLQEYVVAGFPNVSSTLARRILRKFRSIKAFVNAAEEKLQGVEGIGKEKAKKIRRLIDSEYGEE